jgi:hypothetical protein
MLACSHKKAETEPPVSDTTKIIELAIKASLDHHRLPEDGQLKSKYYFKDSILFTTDSLPIEYLPKSVDSVKFKILRKDEICRLISADSLSDNQPNYLAITIFKKVDSGYQVCVASLSCIPYGGGGAHIVEIFKKGDSLTVLHKGSLSIN